MCAREGFVPKTRSKICDETPSLRGIFSKSLEPAAAYSPSGAVMRRLVMGREGGGLKVGVVGRLRGRVGVVGVCVGGRGCCKEEASLTQFLMRPLCV